MNCNAKLTGFNTKKMPDGDEITYVYLVDRDQGEKFSAISRVSVAILETLKGKLCKADILLADRQKEDGGYRRSVQLVALEGV